MIKALMGLYWRLRKLILLWPVATAIMLIGLLAGVAGFVYWYGPTFARYPVWQWPFVPDCPLFALLFVPALALILLERKRMPTQTWPTQTWGYIRLPFYNAWAAFGLIKYGTWTVFVWVAYWINTGGNFTGESVIMTLSHLGMILEGLFLLSFLRMDWPTVIVCAFWYGLSDWMDYGPFQTYPHFDTRIVSLDLIQWHTIAMTVLLSGLYAYIAWRRCGLRLWNRRFERQRKAKVNAHADVGLHPSAKSRRPFLLWALVLWLLALAIASLWRGLTLWRARALLAELGSSLSPPVLVLFVVLSSLCALGLGASAAGLWQRRRWGRLSARLAIVAYFALVQAYTWLFVQSGLMWQRRWASLILALGTAGIAFGILTWRRSRRWLSVQ